MDSNSKLYAILSYIGILWIIGLIVAKDDEFVKFHVNEGIILTIVAVVLNIAGIILGFIPLIGWLITGVFGLVTLVLIILGVVNAANGQMKPLPIIGGKLKLVK